MKKQTTKIFPQKDMNRPRHSGVAPYSLYWHTASHAPPCDYGNPDSLKNWAINNGMNGIVKYKKKLQKDTNR
jgi:hypothetical protein